MGNTYSTLGEKESSLKGINIDMVEINRPIQDVSLPKKPVEKNSNT